MSSPRGSYYLTTRSTLSNHGFSDARGTISLFDHLLGALKRILLPTTPITSVGTDYHWGKETTRLVSAPAVLTSEFDAYAAISPVLPRPPPPGLVKLKFYKGSKAPFNLWILP